jgi:hypothetical protein
MNSYLDFLEQKAGKTVDRQSITGVDIHPQLKPFQRDCVEMLLSIGKGAAFLDTGLGKTIIQCEWARHVPGSVIIAAPLAVAHQTVKEAEKLLGLKIEYSKDGTVNQKITITNYERLDNFDLSRFNGVVLDESSILKGQTSKTRAFLCDAFKHTPYKLCCTATPAPNDYTELGNHAEFLGIMSTMEMLTRWFVHDSANTADWRLKGHARKHFWEWVSSWAACVSKPSDLGYPNDEYDLPPLNIETMIKKTGLVAAREEGFLFDVSKFGSISSMDLHRWKRHSVEDRVKLVADMVNTNYKPWIVWCESNQESELLAKAIPDAVEVKGGDSADTKEQRLVDFAEGRARVIVSKPSICGFGLNWQHCNNIVFASISYSYEKFYQAIRRSWRFGQKNPVNVCVVIADAELSVWRAIERKATDHESMKEHMKWAVFKRGTESKVKIGYNPRHIGRLPKWILEESKL